MMMMLNTKGSIPKENKQRMIAFDNKNIVILSSPW